MGPLLDELLRAARLSDHEVMRRTGVNRLTVRRVRKGQVSRPSWHVCARLAVLLGADTLDVLAAAVESIRRARERTANS